MSNTKGKSPSSSSFIVKRFGGKKGKGEKEDEKNKRGVGKTSSHLTLQVIQKIIIGLGLESNRLIICHALQLQRILSNVMKLSTSR